jgi:hypothetical protein
MLLSKASRNKSRYLTVTGQANAFQTKVANDEEYEWMTEAILATFTRAQAALDEGVKSNAFALNFYSGASSQALKAKYPHLEENQEPKTHRMSSLHSHQVFVGASYSYSHSYQSSRHSVDKKCMRYSSYSSLLLER